MGVGAGVGEWGMGETMDDRELLELTRMAMEVEDLESGGVSGPRLRLVGAPESPAERFRRGLMFAGGLIAAAACLAMAVAVLAPRVPSGPPAVGPMARGEGDRSKPLMVAENPKAAAPEQCVLLAVFQGEDGCRCTEFKRQEWAGGKRLADVGRKELLDAVFETPCTNGAERVVVVAVAGPADSLPKTTEAAEAIASRLASAPPTWHEDITSYAAAAMPDLPKGATVVAKSLAMNR